MSYHVTVINNSGLPVTASDGTAIPPKGTWVSSIIGNAYVESSMLGHLTFLDIGEQHIPGDSSETWGVLITYQGRHAVGRYEGGGKLTATINMLQQVALDGMTLRIAQYNPLVPHLALPPA